MKLKLKKNDNKELIVWNYENKKILILSEIKTIDFCIFVTSQQINFEFKEIFKY